MKKKYYHIKSGKTFLYERSRYTHMTIDVYDNEEKFIGTYDSLDDLRISLDELNKKNTD